MRSWRGLAEAPAFGSCFALESTEPGLRAYDLDFRSSTEWLTSQVALISRVSQNSSIQSWVLAGVLRWQLHPELKRQECPHDNPKASRKGTIRRFHAEKESMRSIWPLHKLRMP